jgi:hypothetical protein
MRAIVRFCLALAPVLFLAGCSDELPTEVPASGPRVESSMASSQPRGRLVAWGYDFAGQVSNAPAGDDFVMASAGLRHGVALRANGSLASWGWNGGNVVTNTPAGTDFVAASAGWDWSAALTTSDDVPS